MTARPFLRMAHECRIRGAIKQANGITTVGELSRMLGIEKHTVSRIVRRKGYILHNGRSDVIDAINMRKGQPQELVF